MKVLVVEDSVALRERLLSLLALSGRYEGVACRCRPGEAIDVARDAAAVLLDLRLGDDNGLDLLETLREHGLTLPVVVLADEDGRQYRSRAAAMGADALLCKPTQFEQIVPTLDRLIAAATPTAH